MRTTWKEKTKTTTPARTGAPRSVPAGLLAAAVTGVLLAATGAEAQTVRELRRVVVSTDVAGVDLVEPWLALDPTDPARLLAVAMFPDTDSSAVWLSEDAGRGWTRTGPGGAAFPGGDPQVAFGPDGTAFVITITPLLHVWRSRDGGRSWTDPVVVEGGSYDRPWIAVDGSDGPHRGRVHTAGKIWIRVLDSPARDLMAFSHSTDGGATFRPPDLVLPHPDRAFLHIVNDLEILPGGRPVAVFATFEPGRGSGGEIEGRFRLLTSGNGGRDWTDPVDMAVHRAYPNARGRQAMMGLGAGGLAVDRSDGPTRGRLHFAWVAPRGGRLQVHAITSPDGGRSWSEPLRVNDGGFGSDHSNVGVEVGARGTVLAVWNDRRDDPGGACFALYAAASVDGGARWGPNRRLADGATCPRGGRWLNGGDTQGIAAAPDGTFHLAWIDGSDGAMRLVSSAVEVVGGR